VDDRAAHAQSFGPAAGRYERGRPPYPPAAVDWLLPDGWLVPDGWPVPDGWLAPDGTRRVLDLGAGTGKLTRQLADRGLAVTAVDPSDGMLTELRRVLPDVPALTGTAEQIPLPDHAVDAVLVAQAWHWVDPDRAVPEVARVLSPGGRLGLIWNLRDEREDWVRRLGEIMGGEDRHRATTIGPPFGPAETREFEWTNRITPDQLLDLVASRSYVILLPPDERAALLAQVRQLMATHPALVGRTEFDMPYVTQCTRASLTSGAVDLAYRATGAPDAPPMVLLHGLGDEASDWQPVLDGLAATHRVYALDLRGHGRSPHPGRYSFEAMRDDVLAFLDTAGIARCVMIGHSMGGMVALLLAETAPQRLSHLIVEDAPVPRPGTFERPPLPPPDEPTPFDFAAVNAIRAQLNDPDPAWWQRTETVAVPTLLIGGGPDSPMPQDLLTEMATRMPNAVLVTIPAGHNIHAAQPAEFLAAVNEFLATH
jgi:pimeloyl-ACP methyl ester carboxylesterase/SAM-dependent methyltransferase